MLAAIRRIEADPALSDHDKARARQEILGGAAQRKAAAEEEDEDGDDDEDPLVKRFSCTFCMKLPDRPVTVSTTLPPHRLTPVTPIILLVIR
jgi:E3 ubiquitin-protein ligase UHRF1